MNSLPRGGIPQLRIAHCKRVGAKRNIMSCPSSASFASSKIQAVFGSDIQHDVSMKVLTEFLEAWKKNVESAHKKNKSVISYGKEQGPE